MSTYVQEFKDFFNAVGAMIQNGKRRNDIAPVKLAPTIDWDNYYAKNRKRKLDFQFDRAIERAEKAKQVAQPNA